MSGKQFLLIVGAASLVIWILGNLLWGPPGYSSEYLEANKAEHDHYLAITKSTEYKKYDQRPWLNKEAVPAEDIEFVSQYESNPDFKREQFRRAKYNTFFDFFRFGLVLVIVVFFAKDPVTKLLDEQIAALREKMHTSSQAREEAEARKNQAQANIEAIPEEQQRLEKETRVRLDRELAQLEESNQRSIAIMEQELEDRKRDAELAAARALKAELVNMAIQKMLDDVAQHQSEAHQSALIDRFAEDLEKRV